jgi:hypothetical protein
LVTEKSAKSQYIPPYRFHVEQHLVGVGVFVVVLVGRGVGLTDLVGVAVLVTVGVGEGLWQVQPLSLIKLPPDPCLVIDTDMPQ